MVSPKNFQKRADTTVDVRQKGVGVVCELNNLEWAISPSHTDTDNSLNSYDIQGISLVSGIENSFPYKDGVVLNVPTRH